MKDEISIPRVQGLHPKVIPIFTSFIEAAENGLGITLRVTQGMRSIAYQDALYAQGRTKKGIIVTNAKGGSSYHNYGLAIDLVVMDGKQPDWNYSMSKLLPYMPANMGWGGHWKTIKDYPHFEISFGYTWRQLFVKYGNKDFIPGTEFLNL